MTDLEILIKFRQAEAAGTIYELTKSTHNCVRLNCGHCIAESACRAIVNSDSTGSFDTNYHSWAKRITLHDLSYLQQYYPEYLL